MTGLSLKLSRILDVNSRNALELFVEKNPEVSPAATGRYLLPYSIPVLPFVGTLSFD